MKVVKQEARAEIPPREVEIEVEDLLTTRPSTRMSGLGLEAGDRGVGDANLDGYQLRGLTGAVSRVIIDPGHGGNAVAGRVFCHSGL